ncbi:adenine deaminase [Pseudovibrio exalbescens]|uniref:adenine deaminase n=1 Tax=Pseudovibrio exalbescens TaxID=197461 RepID=UPI0023669EAC|nr:adenine deaminase [Pseudovibrio exalbescens]MDD7910388.1 adenine deaminase [Pseudovibrio exalbescens]
MNSTSPDTVDLTSRIASGKGAQAADLVLKNIGLFSVIDGSVTNTDIAITDGIIVGTHDTYEGRQEIDCTGKIAVPGFIDTHLHIESSLVTPLEFDRCVLPHGVTTVICDPHEIANVHGAKGIQFFLDSALKSIMDIRVNLPSCVPATAFETSGAQLEIEDLLPFKDHPKVIGLAEFMNFPGVLNADEKALAKLDAFQSGHIDGHAPLVTGKALNGYLSAGIRTDHEATSAQEAREKLSKGMTILIREGSVSKDLDALAPVLGPDTSSFMCLCTDDRNPLDIAEEGHLDSMIRRLIAHGIPAKDVYRAASWSAAMTFGLKDRGLLAPGWRADIVLLDDLEGCDVATVIAGGHVVSDAVFAARESVSFGHLKNSVHAPETSPSSFEVEWKSDLPVIGVKAGLILTEHVRAELPSVDGKAVCDLSQDIVKVAVVERHGKNGNIGCGFVSGFGLQRGAIASSVGHDSHNICVVGVDEADMAVAVNRLRDIQGGFAVVDDGKVVAELALPIAGLMSDQPFEDVRHALEHLRERAFALGCTLPEPFLQVAFLPLPVIPHLKITDFGIFDVDRFALA